MDLIQKANYLLNEDVINEEKGAGIYLIKSSAFGRETVGVVNAKGVQDAFDKFTKDKKAVKAAGGKKQLHVTGPVSKAQLKKEREYAEYLASVYDKTY